MGYLYWLCFNCETVTVAIGVISVHYSLQHPLNTDAMSSDTTRSEEVISDFKKRRLTQSALRRIQDLLHEFEQGHAFDRRLALVGVGVVIILLLVSVAFYFLFSGDSITLR
jgi:hypothetical protein